MTTVILILNPHHDHQSDHLAHQVANLGQCFVALDPSAFTDSFPERLQVEMPPDQNHYHNPSELSWLSTTDHSRNQVYSTLIMHILNP